MYQNSRRLAEIQKVFQFSSYQKKRMRAATMFVMKNKLEPKLKDL